MKGRVASYLLVVQEAGRESQWKDSRWVVTTSSLLVCVAAVVCIRSLVRWRHCAVPARHSDHHSAVLYILPRRTNTNDHPIPSHHLTVRFVDRNAAPFALNASGARPPLPGRLANLLADRHIRHTMAAPHPPPAPVPPLHPRPPPLIPSSPQPPAVDQTAQQQAQLIEQQVDHPMEEEQAEADVAGAVDAGGVSPQHQNDEQQQEDQPMAPDDQHETGAHSYAPPGPPAPGPGPGPPRDSTDQAGADRERKHVSREGSPAPAGNRQRTSSGQPELLRDVLRNKVIPDYLNKHLPDFSVADEGNGQRFMVTFKVTAWRGYGDNRPPVWVRGVVSRDHGGRGWDVSMLSDLLVAVRNGTADSDDRFESVSDVIDGLERTVTQWRPARLSSVPYSASDSAPGPSTTSPAAAVGGAAEPPHDESPHDKGLVPARKHAKHRHSHSHRLRSSARAGKEAQQGGPAHDKSVDRSRSLEDRHTHPLGSRPPAHERAPTSTVDEKSNAREGRYQSDVSGVSWSEKCQAWAATWYDTGDGKSKIKCFYMKHHGFDKAKALAERHRRKMERTGQAAVRGRSEHQSGVRGVNYNKTFNAWKADWQVDDSRRYKSFSVDQLGYEEAKKAAIAHIRKTFHKKRSEHQSGVRGVYYNERCKSWVASWQEAGKQKRKAFSVKQLGYEEAKEAAIAHRRKMERLHTSEGGAESHGDQADSRSADDGDDPLPGRQRQAPQLRQSGLRSGVPLRPIARPDTKRQDRREGRPNRNPSHLREGPSRMTPLQRQRQNTSKAEATRDEGRSTPNGDGAIHSARRHGPPAAGQVWVGWRAATWLLPSSRSSAATATTKRHREDSGGGRDRHVSAKLSEAGGHFLATSLVAQAKFADSDAADRQQQGAGASVPEGSIRDQSSDRSPPRKHCRREAALARSSPSVADKRPSSKSGKTADGPEGIRRAAEHRSDVSGVYWYEPGQAWAAHWRSTRDGKQERKCFYVRDHGFHKAKALAEQHRLKMERTGQAAIKHRSEHQSGVRGVTYNKKVNSWLAFWQEGGSRKSKHFMVESLGFEGAKEAAIAHRRRKMERLHTSEAGAKRHGDPADSTRADDGDDPRPVRHRQAPQLRQSGLRSGVPLRPIARPDTKRPRPRRDGRPNRNPSPDIEAPSWLREGPPATPPTRHTASRGPRVPPVEQGDLIRHFYQQLEALGRAHPDTPLCLRFRSGSALTQLAVEVVLPGTPVQSVPLSAATREVMGAAIDAAWACRQQEMDIDGTEDQQPMTHAQRMVLCRLYGQVGHNIGAMLAAVPSLSFASIDSFVRRELPAMVGQRDGEDIKEAASRFIKQLQKTNQQHTTPALPKPLKAADDEQLPGGDELADIDMTMRPPPHQPVKGPHAPNVPQAGDPNEADRMVDGEVGGGRHGGHGNGDGNGGREEGSWDSARLVSAIEHEMGVMAADKRERHGGKLQHVIDKVKEYGISGMSMSLLVEPPQDSDGSDEVRLEAALIDAAREAVFGGIIRRTINRQDG
ncbi:unnamed protein product [Vitrella brassicaformis CCMP3155]|uniref:AP2/ERF domain-containing protein n=2 Tax=Vitrella brassicaformis TaxID=1169539 RepID=A0A0G4EQC5_VITBC|nr:unnamed protein product [Vitrella brassicaformis CCMP3155]|eukprot:CEL99830.1 unnamed protein product [Vitrella brassicaformis CCMP3155]